MLEPDVGRDALKRVLREEHAVSLSGEVYAAPLHHHRVFEDLARDGFPVSEAICARQICLPVHSDMTSDEAGRVIDALRSAVSQPESHSAA
jgi:perosamine synthetase